MTSRALRQRATGSGVFVRDDGVELEIVPGFRERVLGAPRVSVQPKPEWGEADYAAAAEKKMRSVRRLVRGLERWGASLEGATVLEVGCGAGIDSLLLATQRAKRVVGIDLELPLHAPAERGERARRLLRAVLDSIELSERAEEAFDRHPVSLLAMDATRLEFPDASFDFVVSRAALEHVMPIDQALAEMARVVRPGGLLRHRVDPFYWLRGCHKGGLVDLPWAHARLHAHEYRRLVAETEGETVAARRSRHLAGLNQLSLARWRALFEASAFEVLSWDEDVSPLALELLHEHSAVGETALDGVTRRDLVHSSITVWLRKPGVGRSAA